MKGAIVAAVLLLAPVATAAAIGPKATVLVDRLSGDAPLPYDGSGRGFAESKGLSANSCFALFVADSDLLLPGDDNGARNLYRLDRCGGTPAVVQVNTSTGGLPAE